MVVFEPLTQKRCDAAAMRNRLVAVAAVSLLFVAGCSADAEPKVSAPRTTASPTASDMPTPRFTATPTPEPTASTPVRLPEQCLRSGASDLSDTGPIGSAVAGVRLPEGVTLAIGTQVVKSHSDHPGMVDVVVRPCSSGLTVEELIDIGVAIARAIYPLPEAKTVQELHVTSWVPDPANTPYTKQDKKAKVTDYQSVLWDSEGPAVRSSWNTTR